MSEEKLKSILRMYNVKDYSYTFQDGKLKSLDISRNGLEEMTFLEYPLFQDLVKLDCSYNQLIELDISGLTSLEYLNCCDNRLTGVDLSGLTSLKQLQCHHNQLTELDLSGLANLKKLKFIKKN